MSNEVLRRELDIFKNVDYQGAIEGTQTIHYRPINTINESSVIEFNITSSPDEYVDLEKYFFVGQRKNNK